MPIREMMRSLGALLLLATMVGAGGCALESAPSQEAGAAPLSESRASLEPCPCEPGLICSGDVCVLDCTLYRCQTGYFCDPTSNTCAEIISGGGTPPPPPPVTNGCSLTGCPRGYVCTTSGGCEPQGIPTHTGCLDDWECGYGEVCSVSGSVGTCVSGNDGSSCSSNLDCDPGFQCISSRCEDGSADSPCWSSMDCQAGLTCVGGRCM